jgi:GntR family transcriptional repressor for pyruvate dehydrogenase complex
MILSDQRENRLCVKRGQAGFGVRIYRRDDRMPVTVKRTGTKSRSRAHPIRRVSIRTVAAARAGAPISFKRMASARGFENVAEQIRQAILSNGVTAGDRLPSNRELAEQFGVSRALVNEAVRVLEHSGLLTIRPGAHGGMFVSRPAADQLTRHLNLMIRLGGVGLGDLTEFRMAIEGQNAAWAAERATAREIERLDEIVAQLREGLRARRTSAGELEDLHGAFHTLVAEAAHNELSASIVRGIFPAIQELTGLVPLSEFSRGREQLGRIARAIRGRRPGAARDAMKEHVAYFAELLRTAAPGSSSKVASRSPAFHHARSSRRPR